MQENTDPLIEIINRTFNIKHYLRELLELSNFYSAKVEKEKTIESSCKLKDYRRIIKDMSIVLINQKKTKERHVRLVARYELREDHYNYSIERFLF